MKEKLEKLLTEGRARIEAVRSEPELQEVKALLLGKQGSLTELLKEKQMTQYQLFIKSGVPKSTIGNVINCSYDSVKLRVIHEMCQGLGISISEFFDSPLFQEGNLDP